MTSSSWSRRSLGSLGSLSLLAFLGCKPGSDNSEPPAATVDRVLNRLRKRVRRHVADEDRKKRALAKLEQLELLLEEVDRLARVWRRDSRAALDDGAGAAELAVVAGEFNDALRGALRRAAGIALAMRADISPPEWAAVFPPPQEGST